MNMTTQKEEKEGHIKQKTGSAGEDMEKSAYSWWGYKMVQLLWTTVWWSLKN